MNSTYVIYEQATGRINRIVTCPADMVTQQCFPDEAYLEGTVTGYDSYVVNGHVVTRPVLPVTRIGNTLHGVPAGATLTIEGVNYLVDGESVELEFSLPGSYMVTIKAWPYQDWESTFEN